MKVYWFFLIIVFTASCNSTSPSKDDSIPYLLPSKVEKLLLEAIEKNPKNNYCILLESNGLTRKFQLVNGYSHIHERTNHLVLIGQKYYPISFIRFDGIYALKNSSQEVLKRRKDGKPNEELGILSYPMYHGYYQIEINNSGEIIKADYYY
ncbi:hypothetical protein [Dokdonia sp. LLG6352-1]|uniref:hypothetical protein n=1 Tax=Dokdonia sp. LLG6352-1 TaxID=3160831 RepID=UPI00386B884A